MQNDDEFSIDSPQQQPSNKVATSKSMKSLYQQLAQGSTKQEAKSTKKSSSKKEPVEKAEPVVKVNEDSKKIVKAHKTDASFKYVRNKALQNGLREKALSGVLRIMNVISKKQAERNQV